MKLQLPHQAIIPIIWEYTAPRDSLNNWITERSRSVISALSFVILGFIRSEKALNVALMQKKYTFKLELEGKQKFASLSTGIGCVKWT